MDYYGILKVPYRESQSSPRHPHGPFPQLRALVDAENHHPGHQGTYQLLPKVRHVIRLALFVCIPSSRNRGTIAVKYPNLLVCQFAEPSVFRESVAYLVKTHDTKCKYRDYNIINIKRAILDKGSKYSHIFCNIENATDQIEKVPDVAPRISKLQGIKIKEREGERNLACIV